MRAGFVDGVPRDVESLDEWANVPYVDLAGFGPACDVVWLRDGWKGGRCGEGLRSNAVHAAEMGDGAVFQDGVLVESLVVVFVLIVAVLWNR